MIKLEKTHLSSAILPILIISWLIIVNCGGVATSGKSAPTEYYPPQFKGDPPPSFQELPDTSSTKDSLDFSFEDRTHYSPFGPEAPVYAYTLPCTCTVAVDVFDVQKAKVDSVLFGFKYAGKYKFRWANHELKSGNYFLNFRACDFSKIIRATILK